MNKQTNNTTLYNVIAFLTVMIFGSTFVSTKVLMNNGISPAQVFTLRFIIAYIVFLLFIVISKILNPKKVHIRWFSSSLKHEILLVLLGVTGGSLFFLAQNEALNYTSTTNTSLIVCACPLFTVITVGLFYKNERFTKLQTLGSIIALMGVVIVILNGKFILNLNPLGDLLAFVACLSWAFYSLIMRYLSERYSALFITRKIFLYGVLTILPYYLFDNNIPTIEVLTRTEVIINILFLALVASMVGFITWNLCISKIGVLKTTNYAYFNPVATAILAWIILNEKITIFLIVGAIFIISGLLIMNKK